MKICSAREGAVPVSLYFVRHAIAEERDAARWPDDRLRPLTAAGKDKFRQAARGIQLLAPSPDIHLCSPLTRATQTADMLVKHAGWPEPALLEALTPGNSPADATAALQQLGGRQKIAITGHEPNLSELAAFLLTGNGSWPVFTMKKGGLACIHFDEGIEAGRGSLRWLLTQKMLRELGRL